MRDRRATALFVLGIGLLTCLLVVLAGPSLACTTTQPDSDDVRFPRWVSMATDITLVRVTNARKLPRPKYREDLETPYINPFEFTLQTVERIKGAAPPEFKLIGDKLDETMGMTERFADAHEDVGLFWSWFHGSCYFAPTFTDGGEYLLFRDAQGRASYVYGRNPERIPTRDDAWLTAVKALVQNPSLKYGRKAKLVDFLAASRAVVVTKTLTCDREHLPPYSPSSESGWPSPGAKQILTQLWGAPISLKELEETYAWGVFETCDKDQERLIVLHGHWPMRLRVSADQTVDFSGLLDGTAQGMIYDKGLEGSRWFAQVELEGARVWKLSDLKTSLAAAASGRRSTGH